MPGDKEGPDDLGADPCPGDMWDGIGPIHVPGCHRTWRRVAGDLALRVAQERVVPREPRREALDEAREIAALRAE